MVLYRKRIMKRLWVCVIFILLFIVPPIHSQATIRLEDNATPAAPATAARRIYGEDVSEDVYRDISTDQYRSLVAEFTGNGSRYIFDERGATSGANYEARKYLVQKLQYLSNGRINVEVVGDFFNVIGILPGYLPGDHPIIAITAHYDSAELSSGANADGSGIAAMLSLARMLSKYEWPLDIYFIAFNGFNSFIPRSGSIEVSDYFQTQDIEILSLYNVDTLMVADPDGQPDEQIQIGYYEDGQANYHQSQYWADMARMINSKYGGGVMVAVPDDMFSYWSRGDHISFFQDGFRGMTCFYESGRAVDGSSNTPADMWTNADFNYYLGRETTATIGASIAFTMSRKFGEPTTSHYEFSLSAVQYKVMQFVITTPTLVNISSRWFGGPSAYYLFDSNFNQVDYVEFDNASAWEATPVFSTYLTTKGTYYLVAVKLEFVPIGYEISVTYDSDIDGNSILDKNEYWLPLSYFTADQDNDGVSDADEIFHGTDSTTSDTDGDSMSDRYEIDMGFDPTDPSDGNLDADSDGLTNAQECQAGLNPFSKDTDGDGIDDLWELTYGLNPLVNDANLDPDNDHMTNLEEYKAGTDPMQNNIQENPLLLIGAPALVVIPIILYLYVKKKNDELLS